MGEFTLGVGSDWPFGQGSGQHVAPVGRGGWENAQSEKGEKGSEKGRVEHWCSPGAALERFDARVYHGPQQSGMTSAPSSNRAYGFPIHGFPMFFFRRHASVFSHEPDSDLAFRDSFLCSVLIVPGVDSAMAIP